MVSAAKLPPLARAPLRLDMVAGEANMETCPSATAVPAPKHTKSRRKNNVITRVLYDVDAVCAPWRESVEVALDFNDSKVFPAGAARVFEPSVDRLPGPSILRKGSPRRDVSARVSLPDGNSEHVEVDCRRCSYSKTKGVRVNKENCRDPDSVRNIWAEGDIYQYLPEKLQ